MRVALVSTTFRSRQPFDLHAHVRSLAPALARAGATIEVFGVTRGSGIPPYSQRRTEGIDHASGATFGVSVVELADAVEPDRIAASFGAFLDRERPDVCHFESLEGLGTSLVREAKVRRIATLYCARDTWPAHDRTSLVLPDLAPFELGDGESEARAIVAEALVSGIPVDGGQPADLVARDRLRTLLHGQIADADGIAALRDAREAVEARRAEKRVALSAVDRRFAASRLLARQLSATVGRAFTYRAPGIDESLLPSPAAESRKAARAAKKAAPAPLRFTFMGSTTPVGGVRALLDAFATVRARANAPAISLDLFLERTDPQRDDRIRERAATLGVRTHLADAGIDVIDALRGTDVLVFPSRWGEFAPSGPQLAHAAGLPVIATEQPGLTEVLPAQATIFVKPSDAEALGAAMGAIAADRERLDALRAAARALGGADHATSGKDGKRSVEPPMRPEGSRKTIDDEALEWLDTYQSLVGARADEDATGSRLEHVREVSQELSALRELPLPALFARAQEGLGRLRRAFGLTDADHVLLEKVVARGGLVRDRVEQAAVTESELTRSLELLRTAREAMRSEEAARVRRVGELHAVLGQYEQEALARGAEAARKAQEAETSESERDAALERESKTAAERDELGVDLEKQTARAADAEKSIRAAQVRFEEVAGEAETARAALKEIEAERARLAESVEDREEAIGALRTRVVPGERASDEGYASDLESIEAHCVLLERDVETLRRHDEWLGLQAARLAELFQDVARASDSGTIDVPTRDEVLERTSRALDRLSAELGWRRGEMEAARRASESLRVRLVGGALATRVQSWAVGPPQPEEPAVDPGDRPEEQSTTDVTPLADVEGPAAPLPRRAADDTTKVDDAPESASASDNFVAKERSNQ